MLWAMGILSDSTWSLWGFYEILPGFYGDPMGFYQVLGGCAGIL